MSRVWAKSNGITLERHVKEILKAFEVLESRIGDQQVKKTIKLAIVLHDLGKVLPYFQIEVLKNKSYDPVDFSENTNIYHSLASILFINEEKLREILDNDKLFNYLLSAVAFHHWKDALEKDLLYSTDKVRALERKNMLKNLLENLKEEFKNMEVDSVKVDDLLEINGGVLRGILNNSSFVNYLIPFYKIDYLPKHIELDHEEKKKFILISGFLQRCDHYVSFVEDQEDWLLKDENKQMQEINKIEINCEIEDVADCIREIIRRKNSNEAQLWQEEELKGKKDKNIILEAPTGSGKTEFAFLWKGNKKFIYTLPLRVAVEQIFSRAQEVFGENCVSILHGDADIFLLKEIIRRRAEGLEVDPEYHQETLRVYYLSKELSYPVIISTGDQFFPYAMRPPGYPRIYATLSYSGLVIDEVQAYDPKASAIIVKFIEDTVRMGGKFLLMTATLPKHVEEEIKRRIEHNYDYEHINLYEKFRYKYEKIKKHKVELIERGELKEVKDEIAKRAIEEAKKGKRVLVILNTVEMTKEVYDEIIKEKTTEGIVFIKLFHSRMTMNEKRSIKEEIEREFKNPKDEGEREGKILVATQVVEASVNIDADFLLTEICPIDALVQRMGRVLRRYREEYEYVGDSNVIIFGVKGKNNKVKHSGGSMVYPSILIERSWKIINEKNGEVISEYEKYEMVKRLYDENESQGDGLKKYLEEFYMTLDVLDAGYMSDRKEDAQKIFRSIMDMSCVEHEQSTEFKNRLKELIRGKVFSYTIFKDKIVAQFVIPVPYYYRDRKVKVIKTAKEWVDELEEDLKTELELSSEEDKEKYRNRLEKLKRWCKDILAVSFNTLDGSIR